MTKVPKARCSDCDKRLYRSEQEAREALPRALDGNWKNRDKHLDFAWNIYACPHRFGFHIGHSLRAIKAFAASG